MDVRHTQHKVGPERHFHSSFCQHYYDSSVVFDFSHHGALILQTIVM